MPLLVFRLWPLECHHIGALKHVLLTNRNNSACISISWLTAGTCGFETGIWAETISSGQGTYRIPSI